MMITITNGMSATTLLLMLLFSVVTCEERELVVVDSKKIAIGASIPQYSWGHDEENDVRSTFSLRNLFQPRTTRLGLPHSLLLHARLRMFATPILRTVDARTYTRPIIGEP